MTRRRVDRSRGGGRHTSSCSASAGSIGAGRFNSRSSFFFGATSTPSCSVTASPSGRTTRFSVSGQTSYTADPTVPRLGFPSSVTELSCAPCDAWSTGPISSGDPEEPALCGRPRSGHDLRPFGSSACVCVRFTSIGGNNSGVSSASILWSLATTVVALWRSPWFY